MAPSATDELDVFNENNIMDIFNEKSDMFNENSDLFNENIDLFTNENAMDPFNQHIAMDSSGEEPIGATATAETEQSPSNPADVSNQAAEMPESVNLTNEQHCQRQKQLVHMVEQLKQLQQLHKTYRQKNEQMREELSKAKWAEKLEMDSSLDPGESGCSTGLPGDIASLEISTPAKGAVALPEDSSGPELSTEQALERLRNIEARIETLKAPLTRLNDSISRLRDEFDRLGRLVRQVRAYKDFIEQHPAMLTFLPGPALPEHTKALQVEAAAFINPSRDTQTSKEASKKAPLSAWKKHLASKTMSWYNQTSAAPTQIKELGGPLLKTLDREAREGRPQWKGRLNYDQIRTSWDPNGVGPKKRAREEEQHQEGAGATATKRAKTRSERETELEQFILESLVATGEDDADDDGEDEDAAEMAALLDC